MYVYVVLFAITDFWVYDDKLTAAQLAKILSKVFNLEKNSACLLY